MKKLKQNIKITKLLILLTVFFIIGNGVLLGFKAAATFGVKVVTTTEAIQAPEATNFLLIGTDLGGNRTFEEDGVRTDVQMVISLVPQNERNNIEINIMSIPRDVTTEYTCGGFGKINGGADLAARQAIAVGDDPKQAAIDCTVSTVENLFDIVIDYYIAFNFDSFISIVDGIGGVNILNQVAFCEQDENGVADAYCFEEGNIHLDGGGALSYVRQRHQSSDYERGQRQQLVMTSIFAKIISNPAEYIDTFAKILITETDNNLSVDLLVSLLNWSSTTFSTILEKISSGHPLFLDIKNSPFSMDTGFDLTKSFGEDIQNTNTGTYPIFEIYNSYDSIEQSTNVTRYMLTRNSLNLPATAATSDNIDPTIIELQFISTYVHESNDGSGFYSYIDDYTASYINNQFDNNPSFSTNSIVETESEF